MTKEDVLIDLARSQGQSATAVKALLNIINPHPDLIELPRMVVGLVKVFDAAERQPEITLGSGDVRVRSRVCDWLISLTQVPGVTNTLGQRFLPSELPTTSNPVKHQGGGVKVFGFPYAALWLKPKDLDRASSFYRLVAQLLLAFIDSQNRDLHDQRYQSYRALELLSAEDYLDIPSELLIWESHQCFVNACKKYKARNSSSVHAERFAPLCRLVRYCTGEVPVTRFKGGGGGSRTVEQPEVGTYPIHGGTRDYVLDDPDDPDLLPGCYEISSTPEKEEGEELGELAPGEIVPSTEVWKVNDNGVDRPYVADVLSRQGIEEHIVRSRQMLPYSYAHLTLTELARLLFGASNAFEDCIHDLTAVPADPSLRLRMEAILFIHISLWLGQPATQIAEMTVSEPEKEQDSALTLVSGEQPYFRVVVPTPPQAGDPRWQAESGIREAVQHIQLPDLAGSAALIAELHRVFPRKSCQVFSYQTDVLESEAQKLLLVLADGDRRYTLTKIRNFLFTRIYQVTQGDVTAASMLSGVCPPTANTPLYYLQPQAEKLCSFYVQALEHLLVQIYACVGVAYEPAGMSLQQSGAVGATHCLLPETVSSNITALKGVIAKSPRGSLSDMVTWHNHYTLWTVQMFLMATGCRAIRNPLLWLNEFYPGSVAGALSDKDGSDRHMSRLIRLPDMVRKQVSRYEDHCREIDRQLTGYLAPDPDGLWARGSFLSIEAGRISREPIRPIVIYQQMQRVEGYTPHRVNAYRKLVRTELFERGCPGEALAAYMGHWLRGEEPQDTYSSFCPVSYMRVLDQYLVPLMNEVGWSVMASPWRTA